MTAEVYASAIRAALKQEYLSWATARYTPARLRRLRAFTASPANDYNLFAKAKALRCPVLIFRGGMSKRFPPAAEQPFLQAFASKPKLVVCPKSGHFPSTTETAIVVAELKRFLDGVR